MKFQLRDYQVKAKEGIRASIIRGNRRIILRVPTGGGKSSIAASIVKDANAKGTKTLFAVHNKELVRQFADRLRNQMHVASGIIMAGVRPQPKEMNQVASVQSLVRRKMPEVGLIMIDEAHRSMAGTYRKIVDNYPNAVIIGLTATPFRTDGKGLGDVYQDIVDPIKVRDLIDRGYLVGTQVIIPVESVSTEGLKMRAGDYDKKELANLFEDATLVSGVVENYKRFAAGKKAIAFHVNVAISKQVNERFLSVGISSAHLDGNTPAEERDQIVKDFASGKYMVLHNCALFREGFDVPDTECVIMNTATKSLGMYVQCVGRGLRPAEGKDACIVIDHGNNTLEHGYAEDYDLTPFSLDETKKQSDGPVIKKTKTCKKCRCVNPRFELRCIACNQLFEQETKEIKMSESESFVFADRDAVIMAMVEKMDAKKKRIPPYLLRLVQMHKGYKRSWIGFRAIEIGAIDLPISHPAFWRTLEKNITIAEMTAGVRHLVERFSELKKAA